MGAFFTCRPGVPLPKVLQTGVSESEMKGIAVDITAVINKILGESQAKHGGPAFTVALAPTCVLPHGMVASVKE